MKPTIGDRAREIVTGREGVITGEVVYLWGCEQVLLHTRDHDGRPQSDWYDIGRIELVEAAVLAPIQHEGVLVAGPDKPPPIR